MINNSQRTIYGLEYKLDMMMNGSYTPKPNTTLNEKFDIDRDSADPNDKYLTRYLTIGVGGNKVLNNTSGYTYSNHSPIDAALFEHIPFIMRETSIGLSAEEKAKYRFRKVVTIDGVEYEQYFLKVIDDLDITTNTYTINNSANVDNANLTIFDTETPKLLNPVPREPINDIGAGVLFVSKIVKIAFRLTYSELTELQNVLTLLYGTTDLPITEIGICNGIGKNIDGVDKVLNAQVFFHVGVDIKTNLTYDPNVGYLRAIEIGGVEPIYV